MSFTFLVGGAKSGKSKIALDIARKYEMHHKGQVQFIATAMPGDEEMVAKIKLHVKERPSTFITIEEPINIIGALNQITEGFVIVDCFTLWINNLLEADLSDAEVLEKAKEVATICHEKSWFSVLISNEVGAGIVPANNYTRRYRDLLGSVNQILASYAQKSYFVIAGKLLAISDLGGIDE